MLKNRERIKRLIACGIAASIVSANGLSVFASELNKLDKVNLALNKKTVASSREVNDKFGEELITDGIKDKPSDPNAKPEILGGQVQEVYRNGYTLILKKQQPLIKLIYFGMVHIQEIIN